MRKAPVSWGSRVSQGGMHGHRESRGVGSPTFCFVYDPAPGHSEMMSSFASLFVAKAKATPEKVVP